MQFIIIIIGVFCACWEDKKEDSAKVTDTASVQDSAADTASEQDSAADTAE